MEGARVFGLIDGDAAESRIAYLSRDSVVELSRVAALGDVAPTEVFRFSAKCEEHRCSHFDGNICTLASRLRGVLEPVVDSLPACTVRASCRWYAEQGREICLRCPQIVTLNASSSDDVLRQAATPQSNRIAD
jgi:hypothetical protein